MNQQYDIDLLACIARENMATFPVTILRLGQALEKVLDARHPFDQDLRLEDFLPEDIASEARKAMLYAGFVA